MSESTTLMLEDLERQILELKKLAVAKKREGDIESAKQSLIQSKQLQLKLDHVRSTGTEITGTGTGSVTITTPPTSSEEGDIVTESESYQVDNDNKSNVEADLIEQLKKSDQEDEEVDINDSNGTSGFSLEEMTDLEMMTEFATGGLTVPTLQDYQTKIDDCKKLAVTFKHQGNTQDALQQLRCMKQLQAVHDALECIIGNNATSDLGDKKTKQDDDDEKEELLRELLMEQNEEDIFNSDALAQLDVDDLLQMDLVEIKDAMTLGMKLPSIESVKRQVEQQKALALRLKQSGDLAGAKNALIKFKTWTQHATSIEQLIMQSNATNDDDIINEGSKEVQEDDLEALFENDAKQRSLETKPPLPVEKPKSSEDLRQEAIRLRDEKKTVEATAVLKLYKQALAREADEAELKQRKEVIQTLRNEVKLAMTQYNRFYFYQRLCDSTGGSQQRQAWCHYAGLCEKAAKLVESAGSKAVTITTGRNSLGSLRLLPEDLTNIVQSATDPTEERVEISILDISDLDGNKVLQSRCRKPTFDLIQFDVHVSIQLPLTESETEKAIDLIFQSTPTESSKFLVSDGGDNSGTGTEISHSLEIKSSLQDRIEFDGEQYLTLARGNSKHAKNVLRRMERRKILITVYCRDVQNPSKSNPSRSWFGGTKKNDANDFTESLNIGKIALETKGLLDHKCIVGEFPLVGNGKRLVGGIIRLCIRTGVSFDACHDGDDAMALMTGMECLPLYSDARHFSIAKSDKVEGATPFNTEVSGPS